MSAVITTQAPHIGPFTLEGRLATGGQAFVYLAHSRTRPLSGPEWVVIKTPKGENAVGGDLRKEISALSRINHPNVVRLLEHDLAATPPYVVLEHVPGVDLHRLLRLSAPTRQGVPEELASFLCRHVARALSSLHEPADQTLPRIFHGDVSPSNVLLSESGEVKLSDFGLCRIEGEESSAPRGPARSSVQPLWGHRGYLAPERLTGTPASAGADVFALGVILAEMLIGGPVFDGEGELARLISMKEGNISRLLQRADTLSAPLLAICRRCLDPDPAERPSAAKVCEALTARIQQSALGDEQLRRSLSSWVTWAKQQTPNSAQAEAELRQSVHVKRASRGLSGQVSRAEPEPARAMLRSAKSGTTRSLSYSDLVALAASGRLEVDDEVALFGNVFEPVGRIRALARHLGPSSTALTSKISPLGPPDYCVDLSETSLIGLLGRLISKKSTGLLLVERNVDEQVERKELYLHAGRVTHISSTEPYDRLGESLIAARVLTRQGLSAALRHMVRTQGQLGESLVALRLVDPVVVYQALCTQGRERVVSLCQWTRGSARFFSGVSRPEVAFPVDIDLHLCLVQAVEAANHAPPAPGCRVVPLADCPPPRSTPTSLPLLNLVPSIARKRVTVGTAFEELSLLSARGVTTNPTTYLLVAHTLGWIDFT